MSMHSLESVAAQCLPPEWKDGARWLRIRLNRGEIYGTRFGRTWMMSDEDIEYMVGRYRNTLQPKPIPSETEVEVEPDSEIGAVSFLDGLSARSRSRLMRAGRSA